MITATQKVGTTSELPDRYIELINGSDADAHEAEEFLQSHGDNEEFIQLAQTANFLRAKIDRYQRQKLVGKR